MLLVLLVFVGVVGFGVGVDCGGRGGAGGCGGGFRVCRNCFVFFLFFSCELQHFFNRLEAENFWKCEHVIALPWKCGTCTDINILGGKKCNMPWNDDAAVFIRDFLFCGVKHVRTGCQDYVELRSYFSILIHVWLGQGDNVGCCCCCCCQNMSKPLLRWLAEILKRIFNTFLSQFVSATRQIPFKP